MKRFMNLYIQESNTPMTMKINSSLFEIPIVNNILVYDTISSTNDRAKELAKRGSVNGTLVIAKKQTAGRGRIGRSFQSPEDEGIYMSLMLRPDIPKDRWSSLTLITALAVAKAVNRLCTINTNIKWPNDIVISHKKLAGILTEAGADYVVIGIGINVNNSIFPESLKHTATSIFMETGRKTNIFTLINTILQEFNNLYLHCIKQKDISYFISDYNALLVSMNREVYLIPHGSSLTEANPYLIDTSLFPSVLCLGIDKNGNLICKDEDGDLKYINSGEVSLRGKNSYY